MCMSFSEALVRVLALAAGMAAGAALVLGFAVVVTPTGSPEQTDLLLVIQSRAKMLEHPQPAPIDLERA